MNEKEFDEKVVNSIIQLRTQMVSDRAICGDAFVEFTDRKIEVLDPKQVIIKSNMCQRCKKEIKDKTVNL